MIFSWKSIWKLKVPTRVAFFLWTTWGKIILSWEIGVACAREMGKQLIIYSFIFLLLESCGLWFLAFLGFSGLFYFYRSNRVSWLARQFWWTLVHRTLEGDSSLCWKGISEVLRDVNELYWIWNWWSSNPCLNGWLCQDCFLFNLLYLGLCLSFDLIKIVTFFYKQ